jgi:hypothetical protein
MAKKHATLQKIVHKSLQLTPSELGSTVAKTSKKSGNQLITPSNGVINSIGEKSQLRAKAHAKYISNCIACAILNHVPKTTLRKSLLRTLGCCQNLQRNGDKLKSLSRYCNSRMCITCSHIRAAQRIDAYYDILNELPDKQFMILSTPNVPGYKLNAAIKEQYKALRAIKKAGRKLKVKIEMKGLRNLEITHNQQANTYHPHWGFIISGKRDADYLLDEWLKHFPTARRGKGNAIFKFESKGERGLLELFKYQTKFLVPIKKKGKVINANALNTIFEAIVKMRTFQPMGIKAAIRITDDVNDLTHEAAYPELQDDGTVADFEFFGHDWYDTATGELLTNYTPSEKLKIEDG